VTSIAWISLSAEKQDIKKGATTMFIISQVVTVATHCIV